MQRICAVKERLGQYYATRIGAVENGLNVLTLWVGILQRVGAVEGRY